MRGVHFETYVGAFLLVLGLGPSAPATAQLSCNQVPEGFEGGLPPAWTVVDTAGGGVVWGTLSSCEEAGNFTAGSGGAACVSSDTAGVSAFATELRTSLFNLQGVSTAGLRFASNYQNFASSDDL